MTEYKRDEKGRIIVFQTQTKRLLIDEKTNSLVMEQLRVEEPKEEMKWAQTRDTTE